MRTRGLAKWVGIAAVAALVGFIVSRIPRTRSLPEGYTYTYFPAGGHRYITEPGGIKKVGQEVLDYEVNGTVITGRVRLRLEHNDVRTFRLDLKTHKVTIGDRL